MTVTMTQRALVAGLTMLKLFHSEFIFKSWVYNVHNSFVVELLPFYVNGIVL